MPRGPSILPATLVGRQAELERLEHAFDTVTVALVVGVAGVGKSALLAALAQRSLRPAVQYGVRPGDNAGDVLDAIRRRLARGRVRQPITNDERLADLVDRMERVEALLVLDDLHHLGDEAQPLVAGLGGALETGRVVAASRERLLEGARDPLRFELRLESLDRGSAHELWGLLDGLYGEASGFEQAWQKIHGNPLLLRRAHAGDLDTEDPIASAADKLDDDERFVAGALALAQLPLERAQLTELLPDGRAVAALRRLVSRLVVVVDGTGAASLHDLFREPVLLRSSESQRESIHAALAEVMQDAKTDLVTRVREVCRHLSGARRFDELVHYARDNAREIVRQGAASELVRVLDAVPTTHRTVELETLRARALARSVDLHRAFTVLESIVVTGTKDPEILLTFARVSLLMGRLDLADEILQPLMERELPEELRLRVMVAFALLATHRGRGDEARARLSAFESEVKDPLARAVINGYHAFTYWLDERDDEAATLVPHARALAQEVLAREDSYRAAVGLPYGLAALLGRLGRIEEAEALLAVARSASAIDEDVLMRLELRLVEGDVRFQKGDRLAALEEFEAVAADAKGGYLLADLWASVFRARVLRSMGRRQAADRLDLESERIGKSTGIEAVVRAIARSRLDREGEQGDEAPLVPDAKLGEWTRRVCREALWRGARGEADRVEALERAVSPHVGAGGYALDRALLLLARAALDETRGQHAEAEEKRRRAFAEGEAEKVDPDLLQALVPQGGSLRIVTPSGRFIANEVDPAGFPIVLDARDHTLRFGEQLLSLKSRSVVRCMLYALAREPEHYLNKERLAQAAWSVEYDPRIHDGALKVNLLRLRALLRETGLAVDHDMDGYRLRGTSKLLFVEPLTR